LSEPEHWPLFGLRLRTPRLELRPMQDDDLEPLIDLARRGVHEPDLMPFANGWTALPEDEFGVRFAQYFWRQRGEWEVDSWRLPFVVRRDGEPLGVQQLSAEAFPVLRTVGSGSWLSRGVQGEGIGTEMRAAVLHFAFAELGAVAAVSGAYRYNTASLRVSAKLGYLPNGVRYDVVGGEAVEGLLFRLPRERWLAEPRIDVEVDGFAACAALFGVVCSLV
jgi:RimJ/RimL family protein N-acetyltransferase